MKLYLRGHDDRYAVEQLQLALFPDEPMEPVDAPFSGDGAVSALHAGKTWLTATASLPVRRPWLPAAAVSLPSLTEAEPSTVLASQYTLSPSITKPVPSEVTPTSVSAALLSPAAGTGMFPVV